MKILYFDCFAGASGDMILSAVSSLGVDTAELLRQIRELPIDDINIEFSTVDRSGISATRAVISVPDSSKHRHLREILAIIADSPLSVPVKERSTLIFQRLAQAEAKAHGIDIEKVHFHEVGALDSIVDVVGACIAFDLLGIDRFACSRIHVGSGFVKMDHGMFPVPPPAVAELLLGAPIYSVEIEGELVTPTGAAIISTLCSEYGGIPDIVVEKTGYGAGARKYTGFPNVLRLFVGETPTERRPTERVIVLETNVDDTSPQILGFVLERALSLGALDCWLTPIQMKKNRPAAMLSILCTPEKAAPLSKMIYSETTTLGVRMREMDRDRLDRTIVRSRTAYGEIDVKVASYRGAVINAMPEYEQVKQAAIKHGQTFRTVRDEALKALGDFAPSR